MNETELNPNDPLFRVSRGLDGDLTDAERAALEQELEASASLRAEARSLAAAEGLLKRWALATVELDWNAHSALAIARIDPETDPSKAEMEGCRLDGLLARWSGDVESVIHADRFVDGVMSRIRREGRSGQARGRWNRVVRIGFPLAAAAALALSAIPLMRLANSRDVMLDIVFERPGDSAAGGSGGGSGRGVGGRVAVAYNRGAPAGWSAPAPGIGMGFVGTGEVDDDWATAAPSYVP